MPGQEYGPQDRGVGRAHPSTAPRRNGGLDDDLGLAQEAHTLISLFLDIEDPEARRRCIAFVRREAHGPAEADTVSAST
ncbi:hypothetical protein ACIQW5_17130 [Methylorubrum thiocyanatum]|uniref:Uncharacterized protein n=1 Tax=Methylorubrum populi TaxID=223967 RepID=A0A833J388_9HYPH|nr:hypothetical protein [Methylorubrum populi]KAB7783294.1 hypothetical protein F8B43_4588 [Methylorubrum populi]